MYVRDSLSKKLPVEKCIPGIRAVVGLGMIFSGSAVMGQLSTASGYTSSEVYSTGGDAIVAFSEGSDGALYYMTSTPSYGLGGLYRWDGVSATNLYTPPSSGYFAGASVVSVNETVYFNYSTSNYSTSNFYIQGYNTSTEVLGSAEETSNYALAAGGSSNPDTLWVSSSDWVNTELSYATTDSSGALSGSPVSIGSVAGGAGPLQFDAAGNLYYASGYGSSVLYAWSAVQVADAISDPVSNALAVADAVLAYDWASDYAGYGGTSLAFDNEGDAFLTLTNFGSPSLLVEFDLDGLSVLALNEIASSTGRLGEVVFEGSELYLSDGDSIYAITPVPEPAETGVLVLAAVAFTVGFRRRRLASV